MQDHAKLSFAVATMRQVCRCSNMHASLAHAIWTVEYSGDDGLQKAASAENSERMTLGRMQCLGKMQLTALSTGRSSQHLCMHAARQLPSSQQACAGIDATHACMQSNLAAAFHGWQAAVAERERLRTMLRHAVACFQQNSLAAAFAAWLTRTRVKRRSRDALRQAKALSQRRTAAAALRLWREYADYSACRKSKLQQVCSWWSPCQQADIEAPVGHAGGCCCQQATCLQLLQCCDQGTASN